MPAPLAPTCAAMEELLPAHTAYPTRTYQPIGTMVGAAA